MDYRSVHVFSKGVGGKVEHTWTEDGEWAEKLPYIVSFCYPPL